MIYNRVQFRMPVTITKVPFVQIAEAESKAGEYLIEDDGPNHIAVYKTTPRVYARVPWSNVLSSFPVEHVPAVGDVARIPTPLLLAIEAEALATVEAADLAEKYKPHLMPPEPKGLPELPRTKPSKRSR